MPDSDFPLWAIQKAREIVSRDGAELYAFARNNDVEGAEAEANILVEDIIRALIEAYEVGMAAHHETTAGAVTTEAVSRTGTRDRSA